VPLSRIAKKAGTPVYVYSANTLRRHARVFREAVSSIQPSGAAGAPASPLCCYAVKAAGTLALLALLRREGYGFDIVSGGELLRAQAAGARADTIVFSGVGKRDDELRAALKAGILQFNCESEEELHQLSRAARAMRKTAPVAIRVNPAVDAKTHPYIATALATSKFGIPAARAAAAYRLCASLPNLRAVGLACHIGSQIGEVRPFVEAARKLRTLFLELRASGHALRQLDLGGGLGVPYGERDAPASPEEYARALGEVLRGLDARLLFEPGRLLVANAAVLLTRVLLTKRGAGARRFAVVDAGMNDLLRPALYQAKHRIEAVREPPPSIRSAPRRRDRFDIVGPVCESADLFAKQLAMHPPAPGELLAIRSAGAYGMSMASNYNARARPAEVLVDGARMRVIRARETLEDLLRGESP
jgi:diaminopimelate decarboxylase